jgi:hypothetical protein
VDPDPHAPPAARPIPGYEPPRIETRLTAEALEREILYAGFPSGGPSGI